MNNNVFDNIRAFPKHPRRAPLGALQVTVADVNVAHVTGTTPATYKTALEKRQVHYMETGMVSRKHHLKKSRAEVTALYCDAGEVIGYRANVRNLYSRKTVCKTFTEVTYGSLREAQRQALNLQMANMYFYNDTVDMFNSAVFVDAIKLTQLEIDTLEPQIHRLPDIDDRWKAVLEDRLATHGLEFLINNKYPPTYKEI